ncbi:MAG: hypothetical protein K9K67_00865 [Bacteriovoracaceae bacterium]|nr:hypothetical protein [Bacteriovoracaceae bacterium]
MKSILIRADGRKDLGMGHLNRCLIISKYLVNQFDCEVHFFIEDDHAARSFLSGKDSSGVNLYFFEKKISLSEQALFLIGRSMSLGCDVVLFDLLEFNLTPELLGPLKRNNIKIACIIDDSNYREVDADLVLNGNPNQKAESYKRFGEKYLIGPEFFIMDRNYDQMPLPPSGELKKLLITLGGSDHNNLLFKLLDSIEGITQVFEISIITSRATGYIDKLQNRASRSSKEIELFVDLDGLYDIWKRFDFAITAGGNTLFERIAAGIPGATLCQLERQMEISDCFEELGVNINLGYGPDLSEDAIHKKISLLLENKSLLIDQVDICRSIVAGAGLRIFSQKLKNLVGENYEKK